MTMTRNVLLSGTAALFSLSCAATMSSAADMPLVKVPVQYVKACNKLDGEGFFTYTVQPKAGKPTGTVRQGSLEGSGVDAAKVMVEMITSLRSFQSGQQAIQAIGQTLQEAASQVGSLP